MTEPTYVTTTRTAYDTVAADYADLLRTELAGNPLNRAVLDAFAELVCATDGPVADLGCGPGRVTAYLDAAGVSAFGIDLSPRMVDVARRTYPALRIEEGSMAALDLKAESLGGILAWYSIIHTPPEHLPQVFAEFHRTLQPGGRLLLAFQVGDERKRIEHAYGHEVSYDAYRLPPDHITELLGQARIPVTARLIREPEGQFERDPQAFLLAQKN